MVLNNRDLNMVSWEQRAMVGDPKFDASQNVPDFPYAEYAKLIGLEGIKVDNPGDIPLALDQVFAAKKPVLLEGVSDPNVPMLPPHISFAQAKAFYSSIIKGDPDAWKMIKQTYKDVLDEYFPVK